MTRLLADTGPLVAYFNRLAERLPDCKLLTLDSDFAHYRRSGRRTIPLLTPERS